MKGSNPYGEFFKKAKQAKSGAAQERPQLQAPVAKAKKKDLSEYSEDELRHLFRLDSKQPKRSKKRSKKKPIFGDVAPVLHFLGLAALIVLAAIMVVFAEEEWNPISDLNIEFFMSAQAADQEKSSAKKGDQKANSSQDSTDDQASSDEGVALTKEEKLSHFANLNKRKEELDLREKELAELERELQNQREQVEARIEYLESVRRDIAGVLQERVEMDEEKVAQLVDFYSNMKPGQAANIISTINEDLAIQVLSKMKKKNAAQILNMIEPAKARVLSEKFAGYKPKN
ncbi:MAG: hypothetical protein HRT45_19380 [Bdellovibrionales bacterium]|nr:hypothetical protein [Bdellovibrionales bacterium]